MDQKNLKIENLKDEQRGLWDDYVDKHSQGTFFHLSGWKYVLEKTFGYQSFYLLATKESKVCGILPLFVVKSLLGGKALISLPFAVYGGICSDNEEVAKLLIKEAEKITKKSGSNYLELRHIKQSNLDMPYKNLYYTFIKELPQQKEKCLANLPRKARASARKGIKSGLTSEFGINLVKEFYNIYAVSVRNLGSPVFSFQFLNNILNEFEKYSTILLTKYQEKAIAGVFTFLYKESILPYFGGALPQYFELQPNNFMYLKLMEYGVQSNCKYFDFGRSKKETGPYYFKKNQGFEPQLLFYEYYLNNIETMPDVSPLNPKVQIAVKIWKKLPVWLTKIIGPKIVKLTPP